MKSTCVASFRMMTPPREGQPKMEMEVSVNATRRVGSRFDVRGEQLGPFRAVVRREDGVRMMKKPRAEW